MLEQDGVQELAGVSRDVQFARALLVGPMCIGFAWFAALQQLFAVFANLSCAVRAKQCV